MPKYIDEKEINRLKNLPKDKLEINQIVFLQGLRIDALETLVRILIDAHSELKKDRL